MASDVNLSITGLQELQAANIQMIAALKPSNDLGRAIQYAAAEAHRYLTAITHIDTGSYRVSQRMAIEAGGARGLLYVDPGATNPRSKNKPVEYSVYEEARGGSHAAYERTVREHGEAIVKRALQYLDKALVQ